jgi:hypothetical protein
MIRVSRQSVIFRIFFVRAGRWKLAGNDAAVLDFGSFLAGFGGSLAFFAGQNWTGHVVRVFLVGLF